MSTTEITTPGSLSEDVIRRYRRDGFARIPGIISRGEAERYRAAALDFQRRRPERNRTAGAESAKIFDQFVNVWEIDETLRDLTLNVNVGRIAERLAGVRLRLWHDQLLIKQPHKSAATEFHQDQPFWPHANAPHALSAWIALCDVPVERGCMTFIPGSQSRTDLSRQSTLDSRALFEQAPDLVWEERVTIPLRAGDCTFHHARCAHTAFGNATDEPRVAHVVIFTDATTTYVERPHPVTADLGLNEGDLLDSPRFPMVTA